MDRQLQKIIKLVARTGDKVVVLDGDHEFVLANLDDYLHLLGEREPVADLSGRELLDKINRDIALWRESQREFESRDREQDFFDEDLSEPADAMPKDFRAQDEIDRITTDIFKPQANYSANANKLPWEDTNPRDPFSPIVPDDFPLSDDEALEDDDLVDLENDSFDDGDNLDLGENFDLEDDHQALPVKAKEFEEFKQPEEFDELEDEIELDEDLKPSELPSIEATDFDFEEAEKKFSEENLPKEDFSFAELSSLKKVKKVAAKLPKPRINNFGFANPVDTGDKINEENDYWLKLDNNNQDNSEFGHIPPPPDLAKR